MPVSPSEKDVLAAALTRMGLLERDGIFTAMRLSGGVSCDVWKIERPGPGREGAQSMKPALVAKRALAKLRVAQNWQAPPERWAAEVAWLKLAREIDPSTAPQILGEDAQSKIFAMEFLESLPVWKAELAAGRVNTGFAAITGHKLANIHAVTAGREDIAKAFANDAQFFALRLEPYLLFTAERHPDVAADIRAMVEAIARARIALMQGDISPKNILVGPWRAGAQSNNPGPVFLDAETACYGDPVFDLGFCLNHLLLKCVWHPEYQDGYLACFRALKDAYLKRCDWEDTRQLEKRAARLLAMLLLARVDGKSPVEYLTDPRDQALVRDTAKDFIYGEEESLDIMAMLWGKRLGSKI